ncbi:MAG TPA: TetR/AcrR family transcriptional regulator [Natronosporangium sp.]|nr:TetR/AcrR family transcriptional regulator [Natronosporangium sp.]
MARVQRMLDACADIVDEVGYEGLTTTLLAERAGVAIGSVYQFFPDKRAVVLALAQRHLQAYLDRLGSRLAAGAPGGWREATRIAVEEHVRMYHDVPGYQALRLADPLGADLWPDREAPAAARVAELLIAAAGLPDRPRTRLAVVVALQAADTVVRSAFRRDPAGDPEVLAEATALVHGYLAARLDA